MTGASITIDRWLPDSRDLDNDIEMLAEVLYACVHAGAGVSFIQPFSLADAKRFWRDRVLPAVRSGACAVVTARQAGRIIGTVQLDLETPPNQPHRAEVRKLLVHPGVRRRGIARALMLEIENQARHAGRTLLTLDTVTGGAAEPLYLSLGFRTVGAIPGYARKPDSPELESTTVMYRTLA